MTLKLHKPLCFFDLETTGTQIGKDRIVEIAILKLFPDGNKVRKSWLVNPEIPIPEQASLIHKIYDKDVAHEPTFKTLAPQIYEMIKNSDLAGFNSNRFDVPLLAEEFLRVGIDFDLANHKLIDVQVIFHKMEPRNLSAAYRFYCQKELIDAHSALADTIATHEILMSQIAKYEMISDNVKDLSDFSTHFKTADLAGFIGYDQEENEIFTFGKYKNKKVTTVFQEDPSYYRWIQNADFPLYTKKILTKIKLRNLT